MRRLLVLVLALVLGAGAAWAAEPRSPESRPPGLVGALQHPEPWRAYKARFVTEAGRVVDTANGGVSHSEGQGYGMLLAVAAGDRAGFERIWGWTRANLMVRDDALAAWRWEPNARPAVADMNNASDGDILIAWALAEAAEAWGDVAHRVAARRIAVEVGRKLVLGRSPFGPLLLPGLAGFSAEEREDGPVVNPSYWVFPALPRLALVAPEFDWAGLSRSGLDLLRAARFGSAQLPTEWVSAKGPQPRPADKVPAVFGYNAVRIPLYLAWAGVGEREHYAPFLALWAARERGGLPVVEVETGRRTEWMGEPGYASVAALTACAGAGAALPRDFAAGRAQENYYPATLHLLSLVAARMRHGSCLRG